MEPTKHSKLVESVTQQTYKPLIKSEVRSLKKKLSERILRLFPIYYGVTCRQFHQHFLLEASMRTDSKSAKKTDGLAVFFCAFEVCER